MTGDVRTKFLNSFEWHSSPIDWCEPNYAVSNSIAEFYNTVSNVVFVVLPCLLLYFFHPFARGHTWRIQMVWGLIIVIGICSAYFHATLSLAGQLLDEFGILWVLAASLAFWLPRKFLPKTLFGDREDGFEMVILLSTVIFTVMGCVWPFLNSFVLMIFSVPVVLIIIADFKRCSDSLARSVALKATVLWLVAVIVWLSDRFACGVWQSLHLPGGHWLWHILVGFASYQGIVFVVYREAIVTVTNARPVIRLWPSDEWKSLGIAYVQLKSPLPEVNGNACKERCKNC